MPTTQPMADPSEAIQQLVQFYDHALLMLGIAISSAVLLVGVVIPIVAAYLQRSWFRTREEDLLKRIEDARTEAADARTEAADALKRAQQVRDEAEHLRVQVADQNEETQDMIYNAAGILFLRFADLFLSMPATGAQAIANADKAFHYTRWGIAEIAKQRRRNNSGAMSSLAELMERSVRLASPHDIAGGGRYAQAIEEDIIPRIENIGWCADVLGRLRSLVQELRSGDMSPLGGQDEASKGPTPS